MTDLRAALIEAIADYACHESHAHKALDAILDVLTDRADEWRRAGEPHPEHSNSACWAHTRGLIAVLRADYLTEETP